MEQDPFFWNLARETIIDILSRLPILSIIRCKRVCKSWLDLVECAEFAKSHESRSVPGLALSLPASKPYEIIEIMEALDHQNYLPHSNLTAFSFSFHEYDNRLSDVHSSVNGLIFLFNGVNRNLIICNPVTRQYIHLPHPVDRVRHADFTYGFGVSKVSGQYKLMRITSSYSAELQYCEVYTLGTGLMWRRIDATLPHGYDWTSAGVFFNGNLHWLRYYGGVDHRISYLDLETEHVSSFSLPPFETKGYDLHLIRLSALGDYLCFCDNTGHVKNDIWMMKEYGDDKSWVKQFIISIPLHNRLLLCRQALFPVKVFKDGDILVVVDERCTGLFCYFNKTKTIQKLDVPLIRPCYSSCIYTPRFLDLLKTFAMENVYSF